MKDNKQGFKPLSIIGKNIDYNLYNGESKHLTSNHMLKECLILGYYQLKHKWILDSKIANCVVLIVMIIELHKL